MAVVKVHRQALWNAVLNRKFTNVDLFGKPSEHYVFQKILLHGAGVLGSDNFSLRSVGILTHLMYRFAVCSHRCSLHDYSQTNKIHKFFI